MMKKLPHTWWLKTTQNYLIILDAGGTIMSFTGLKLRCWQVLFLFEAQRVLFPAFPRCGGHLHSSSFYRQWLLLYRVHSDNPT